jgi:hypothetical protein
MAIGGIRSGGGADGRRPVLSRNVKVSSADATTTAETLATEKIQTEQHKQKTTQGKACVRTERVGSVVATSLTKGQILAGSRRS